MSEDANPNVSAAKVARADDRSPSPPSASSPSSSLHRLLTLNPSMAAGAGAGLVSSVVTCPLDVVKTRLQAQTVGTNHHTYQGVLATGRTILSQAGLRGFYRGLGPTVLGYLPTWAIYFSVYDAVKTKLGDDSRSQPGTKQPPSSIWLHITAAMTAGATGTIVTNPLWVIKTRFMAQSVPTGQKRYKHTLDAMQTIYRTEGLRAFYKGLTPSLMGVSHVAVQFPLYERLKLWAAPEDGGPLPPTTILLCSSLSKMIATMTTYPHEVLRTRLQIQRVSRSRTPQPSASSSSPSSPANSSPNASTTSSRSYTSSPPSSSHSSPSSSSALPLPPNKPHDPPISVRTGGGMGVRQGESSYKGVVETFSRILQESGWKGFYRGLGINLVRTVPNSAVTMLTYELIMRYLTNPPQPRDDV